MRWAALGLIAFALAACNTMSGETTPEQTASAAALLACFDREAARLDDGFSDPLAIGMAVTSACYGAEEHALATATAWHTYAFDERWRSRMEPEYLKLAVGAVLLHRREIRGG